MQLSIDGIKTNHIDISASQLKQILDILNKGEIMGKKDSIAWQLALKLCRRKGSNKKPIELVDNDKVRFASLIRGNTWIYSIKEIEQLLITKGK